MDATDMRVLYGAGPCGATCQDCAHLNATTSQPRPSEHARSHRPLTLFSCDLAAAPRWSLHFVACGKFQRAA